MGVALIGGICLPHQVRHVDAQFLLHIRPVLIYGRRQGRYLRLGAVNSRLGIGNFPLTGARY